MWLGGVNEEPYLSQLAESKKPKLRFLEQADRNVTRVSNLFPPSLGLLRYQENNWSPRVRIIINVGPMTLMGPLPIAMPSKDGGLNIEFPPVRSVSFWSVGYDMIA